MRQAGVLAAPGIIALTEMIGRLGEDHARAKILAAALSQRPGIKLNPDEIETNIVIFKFSHPRISVSELLAELGKRRILAMATSAGIRFVTHKDIDDEDLDRAITALKEILG